MTQLNADLTKPRCAVAPTSRNRPVARPSELSILLDRADSTRRDALEACVADTFARRYKARIEHFLPYLLSLNLSNQLGAVVGLRLAGETSLFLEQYLRRPVEQAVAGAYRTPVDRAQIIEVGNLASIVPGSAALLFGLLPIILHEAGIRWVVCTATPQVQSMLDRLDFPAKKICSADAEVLGDSKKDWGSYYDCLPDVIVGDVDQALPLALANQHTGRLAKALAGSIRHLGASLRYGS